PPDRRHGRVVLRGRRPPQPPRPDLARRGRPDRRVDPEFPLPGAGEPRRGLPQGPLRRPRRLPRPPQGPRPRRRARRGRPRRQARPRLEEPGGIRPGRRLRPRLVIPNLAGHPPLVGRAPPTDLLAAPGVRWAVPTLRGSTHPGDPV